MRTGVLVCCALLAGCDRHDDAPLVIAGDTMGTRYEVTLVPPVPVAADTLQQEILSVLTAINHSMSTWEEDSELMRLNRAESGVWLPVSTELLTVLMAAEAVSRETAGVFDVTIAPLVNLWGFGPAGSPDKMPTEGEILRARLKTGYRLVRLRDKEPAIFKESDQVAMDLSAIAKGYAVDRVAELLEARGLLRYLVNIGGEIRAAGLNTRNQPWHIGIEQPLVEERIAGSTVLLENGGMATSGDYRNFNELDGHRYSHTIDPYTGAPVEHDLASVTVLHPSAMIADALATALLVMGPDKGFRYASERRIPALFIRRSGNTFSETYTTAMLSYLDRAH